MPNKVYIAPETAITWRNTGGSAALTLTSVAASAGRQGAHYSLDGGTGADRSGYYMWRAWVKFATTPVVGEVVELYLKTSDGTHPDNDDGTGDIAVSSSDKLKNLLPIGVIIVDEASTTPEFVASGGPVFIGSDDVAPVFWNATADALSATASDHGFDLIPVPPEIQ